MNVALPQPIQQFGDSYRDDPNLSSSSVVTPIISKVKGLAMGRIGGSGALLPSATAPRLVLDFLSPPVAIPTHNEENEADPLQLKKESKRSKLRKAAGKSVPVGLRSVEPGWINPINALMQFLLYLPGFVDLFYCAPRSFHCFLDFIERYLIDQEENRTISTAHSGVLVRCLMKKLPHHLFRNAHQANLFEILQGFARALFPHFRPETSLKSTNDSIFLHAERQIIWEINSDQTLEDAILKKWAERAPEILVAIKGTDRAACHLIKRQFFTPDWHCYDLHAFIEHRPDGISDASFLTYLKIDGGWYQCDDERITPLRSNCLHIPLHRSILLYFKRIQFGASSNRAI